MARRKASSIKDIVNDYFDAVTKSRFTEMFLDYDKVPVTELADIVMGQSPDSSTYNNEGIGIPFYQGKSEFTDVFVRVDKFCSEPKKVAKEMDILMSVRAPVGAVNITKQKCCIGRGLAAITPLADKTNVWFLFNALKIMEKQISDMGVGSTFTAISKDDMQKIKIPLAPLNLQNQFSDFVKQVERIRIHILQLLDDLELSIKSKFIELFGNPISNTFNWPSSSLKELSVLLCNGKNVADATTDYVDSGIPLLQSQNVWPNHFELDNILFIPDSLHEKMSKTELKTNDILITKTGRINTENSSLGRIAMYEDQLPRANISGEIYLIRLNDQVIPKFVLYLLLTDSYRAYIRSCCPGGTDKRHLYIDKVEKFPIIVPPIKLQQKFVDYVDQVDSIKDLIIRTLTPINTSEATSEE